MLRMFNHRTFRLTNQFTRSVSQKINQQSQVAVDKETPFFKLAFNKPLIDSDKERYLAQRIHQAEQQTQKIMEDYQQLTKQTKEWQKQLDVLKKPMDQHHQSRQQLDHVTQHLFSNLYNAILKNSKKLPIGELNYNSEAFEFLAPLLQKYGFKIITKEMLLERPNEFVRASIPSANHEFSDWHDSFDKEYKKVWKLANDKINEDVQKLKDELTPVMIDGVQLNMHIKFSPCPAALKQFTEWARDEHEITIVQEGAYVLASTFQSNRMNLGYT